MAQSVSNNSSLSLSHDNGVPFFGPCTYYLTSCHTTTHPQHARLPTLTAGLNMRRSNGVMIYGAMFCQSEIDDKCMCEFNNIVLICTMGEPGGFAV